MLQFFKNWWPMITMNPVTALLLVLLLNWLEIGLPQ